MDVSGNCYKRVEGSMAQEIQELDDDDHDDQPSGREAVSFSQPAVLAGFKRVAPHFHELQISPASDIILPLVPELLGLAANRSPHLESLTFGRGFGRQTSLQGCTGGKCVSSTKRHDIFSSGPLTLPNSKHLVR